MKIVQKVARVPLHSEGRKTLPTLLEKHSLKILRYTYVFLSDIVNILQLYSLQNSHTMALRFYGVYYYFYFVFH